MGFLKNLFGNKQSASSLGNHSEASNNATSDPLERAKRLLPKWRAAVAQDDASNFVMAKRLYLELIRECPGVLSAYNNLAVLDIFEGNIKSAQENAEKATQYLYSTAQNTLGVVYVRQGSLPQAMLAFQKGGGSKQALTNLCGVCAELGKYDEAISAGEQALKLDAKSPPTYTNLIRAYGKAGLTQKAEETTRIALNHVTAQSLRSDLMVGRDSVFTVADIEGNHLIKIDQNGSLFTMTLV